VSSPVVHGGTGGDLRTRRHRAARFGLVSFAIDVFSRPKPRRVRSETIPVGEPEAMTREAVEALQVIMNRGTLAFLCREGGWRRLALVREGHEHPVEGVRIVDPRVWREVGELRFGAAGLEALVIGFNAVTLEPPTRGSDQERARRKRTRTEDGAWRVPRHNGDLLVHHVVGRRVEALGVPLHAPERRYLRANPLTRVVEMTQTSTAASDVERVLDDDLRALLPWLDRYIVGHWERHFSTMWTTLEIFDDFQRRASAILEAWIERSHQRGRRDLLRMPLELFSRLFVGRDVEARWQQRFDALMQGISHRERRGYQERWARTLGQATALREAYRQARNVHPIDREAADKIFMRDYEARSFDEVAGRAEALAREISGVIG
jgi:hypothetical protein